MFKRTKAEARRGLLLSLVFLGLITAIIAIPYHFGTEAAGGGSAAQNPPATAPETAPQNTAGDSNLVELAHQLSDIPDSAMPRTIRGKNGQEVIVGRSYHNDVSPPLRDMVQLPMKARENEEEQPAVEANRNPEMDANAHKDAPDAIVQNFLSPNAMP